jgi:hypothetical protein
VLLTTFCLFLSKYRFIFLERRPPYLGERLQASGLPLCDDFPLTLSLGFSFRELLFQFLKTLYFMISVSKLLNRVLVLLFKEILKVVT